MGQIVSVVPPILVVGRIGWVVKLVEVLGGAVTPNLDPGYVEGISLIAAPNGLEFVVAITSIFVVAGEQDPAPHDVPLVAPGSEGGAHPAPDKDLAVVGVVGDGAPVPTRMPVLGVVFSG